MLTQSWTYPVHLISGYQNPERNGNSGGLLPSLHLPLRPHLSVNRQSRLVFRREWGVFFPYEINKAKHKHKLAFATGDQIPLCQQWQSTLDWCEFSSYLETVGGIKVQLVWEVSQSSFIGHCCLRHDWAFGQLKHPVGGRSIVDVTCKTNSGLSRGLKIFTRHHRSALSLWYLLLLWAHCYKPQCGSMRRGKACWILRCGPTKSDPARTESHPFLHLSPNTKRSHQGDI